jgi:hypothetical protein
MLPDSDAELLPLPAELDAELVPLFSLEPHPTRPTAITQA